MNLPDTPDWSPRRYAAIRCTWRFGAAMVVTGAAGGFSGMSDATAGELITWGVGLIGLAVTTFIGGASAERWAAWSAASRKQASYGGWSGYSPTPGDHPDGGGRPFEA